MDIRKTMQQLLTTYDGLHAIVVSDRDGVAIIKVSTENTPELALRMSFLATFGNSNEQAGKLGMGKNNRIISIYENYQVIQISKLPIVITLIAETDANTGHLLELEEKLDPLVQSLSGDVVAAAADC